jgi:biopolymer transport protein ExbB/TolQ
MNKFNLFFEKHGMKVLTLFVILTWFKACSVDSELTLVKKELRKEQEIVNTIKKLPTSIDLQIESLKAEKRMIQATNRKMLDVQRQNEIEKEIAELESKK